MRNRTIVPMMTRIKLFVKAISLCTRPKAIRTILKYRIGSRSPRLDQSRKDGVKNNKQTIAKSILEPFLRELSFIRMIRAIEVSSKESNRRDNKLETPNNDNTFAGA